MSVYIGPCNYVDETEISEPRGNPSEIVGDLDMQNYRTVNVQQCEENRSDAATVGYISDKIGRISHTKVDWNGGTMKGDLNSNNRVFQIMTRML